MLNILILFGAIFLLINYRVSSAELYWMLYLYISLLWLLWVLKVILTRSSILRNLTSWLLLDLLVLALLLSVSSHTIVDYHSKGNELVMFVTYFFIIIPSIFLPLDILVSLLSNLVQNLNLENSAIFLMWSEMSVYALSQAIFLIFIRLYIDFRTKKNLA